MAAAAAGALVASGDSGDSMVSSNGGSPPPPVGFVGPDAPHCSPSAGQSPLASGVQAGIDFLNTKMKDEQCANDHPDGPRGKSGCSMMYSGHDARLYMCGTFGVKVDCTTAGEAVQSMVQNPDCTIDTTDGDAYVGGENFVTPDSPLYVTVALDEGPP